MTDESATPERPGLDEGQPPPAPAGADPGSGTVAPAAEVAGAGADAPPPPSAAPPPQPEAAPSSSWTPPTGVPMKYCYVCGATIDARAEICPRCGVRQQPPPAPSLDAQLGHSRILAALLGIFLGSFGIHKFYLGKTGQGILYLIFFWTLIPGIVGFIEGIWYLTMTDAEFQLRFPER